MIRIRLLKFSHILFQFIAITFIFASCHNNEPNNIGRKVYIQNTDGKYTLIRNGQAYYIKGAAGNTNLKKLHEIGGNTIRTYDTLNLGAILDEAHQNNIAVMVGFPLPESKHTKYVYDQPKVSEKIIQDYSNLVKRYKDHPAVLMWCVGNELDFSLNVIKQFNFYKTFNAIVASIHSIDRDHPVTTTIVNLPRRDLFCIRMFTKVDIVSTNIFSSLEKMTYLLKKASLFWEGPFIISEWGIEGPWLKNKNAWGAFLEETSTEKAKRYEYINQFIPEDNPRFIGAFVFYWGSKQETTHTWFSMLDEQGRETEAVTVMEKIWTGKTQRKTPPQVLDIHLNNKTGKDNIIFKPGGEAQADLIIENPDSSFNTVWEVYPEDWFLPRNEKNTKRLKPVIESILTSDLKSARFKIPKKEGPYRLFATVYDTSGTFASCNIPFYVVSN